MFVLFVLCRHDLRFCCRLVLHLHMILSHTTDSLDFVSVAAAAASSPWPWPRRSAAAAQCAVPRPRRGCAAAVICGKIHRPFGVRCVRINFPSPRFGPRSCAFQVSQVSASGNHTGAFFSASGSLASVCVRSFGARALILKNPGCIFEALSRY